MPLFKSNKKTKDFSSIFECRRLKLARLQRTKV